MGKETKINLVITRESLEKFCNEVAIGSANTNRKHAAFMALEAFISRHALSDAHTNAYNTIQQIVSEFSEQTREQLLRENATELATAIENKKIPIIARIFSSVSRNGFKQVLDASMRQVNKNSSDNVKQWVFEWCNEAKIRAQEASGYPDALDFRNIDIDLIEYTAMSEINTIMQDL